MNPRHIREAAGFTVREMAGRLGVSTQRVYAIESSDDWMVSTVRDYYRACVSPGDIDARELLVLASKCLIGSLERWEHDSSLVQMDFRHLCDAWENVFEMSVDGRDEDPNDQT